jgi:hypothetical protein
VSVPGGRFRRGFRTCRASWAASPYRIRVPANWNGRLIVYAHGYREAALPLALAPLPADVEELLAKGFALAASRFGRGVRVPPQTRGPHLKADLVRRPPSGARMPVSDIVVRQEPAPARRSFAGLSA